MTKQEFKRKMVKARTMVEKGLCCCLAFYHGGIYTDTFVEYFAPYELSENFNDFRSKPGVDGNDAYWLGHNTEKNKQLRLFFLDYFEAWALHKISDYAYKRF